MLKKPSILACLGLYCSVFKDFALFARGYMSFSSFAEGLTQGQARSLYGKHLSLGGALTVLSNAS